MGFNKMVEEVRGADLVVPLVSEVPNHLVVTFTRPGWAPIAYKKGLSDSRVTCLTCCLLTMDCRLPRLNGCLAGHAFRELADRGLVDLVGQTRSARWVPIRDVIGAKSSETRML
jgi:hypothetical protein